MIGNSVRALSISLPTFRAVLLMHLCAATSQESNATIVCPLCAEFEKALGLVVQIPE